MEKRIRRLPATEFRVHLGEALRSLDEGDVIIEKGGVPIARLTKSMSDSGAVEMNTTTDAYTRAVVKRAAPNGWARAVAAMKRGWVGIDADAMVSDIYAAREAGASDRTYTIDSEDGEDALPSRQRRVRPPASEGKRVAEGDDSQYRV